MKNTLAVLAIGDELLDGRLIDTNSNFVSKQAFELGVQCKHVLLCRDNETEIITALSFLASEVDLIVVSGGLGPTTDDKTRSAIAKFCDDQLVIDKNVLELLRQIYSSKKRSFDKSNEQQAYFPTQARVLENPVGTAPAFHVPRSSKAPDIIALPGVPGEFSQLWKKHCEPFIKTSFETEQQLSSYMSIFGYPESKLNSVVTDLKLPEELQVSYRASFPVIDLVLKSYDKQLLESWTSTVLSTLGSDFCISKDPAQSLVEVVAAIIKEASSTLSYAESCTGGLLSSMLTSLAGVSSFFKGSVVSYANEVKQEVLGVPAEVLQNYGAVSHEVALQMVKGVSETLDSDYALSITGIAGPTGGSEAKPVGLFFVGCLTPKFHGSFEFYFKSERIKIQRFAAFCALDVLRRVLLELGVPLAKSQKIT